MCSPPRARCCSASSGRGHAGRGHAGRGLVGRVANTRRLGAGGSPPGRGGARESTQPQSTRDRGVCAAHEQHGVRNRPRKYVGLGEGGGPAQGFGRQCRPAVRRGSPLLERPHWPTGTKASGADSREHRHCAWSIGRPTLVGADDRAMVGDTAARRPWTWPRGDIEELAHDRSGGQSSHTFSVDVLEECL